jgi:hypothetical protein
VRHLAGGTVFIFHASGLPVFVNAGPLRRLMGHLAYRGAAVALEVAQEVVTPHEVFGAKSWQWCPCAIAVPDSVDERDRAPGPLTALFVGSLQEGKGVVEIFKTATLLKKQGREKEFRFRIVGKWFSQAFEDDIRHMRSELGLEEMVELAGQLTGDDKWRAYAEADVFFFPTHYASEATPIVLMEALGMGLPLLTTQWAGIPAMLEGCETACLLPVRSPERYATALEDLHHRSHELSGMHRASRDFYQKNFLPERFIERVGNAFVDAVRMADIESTTVTDRRCSSEASSSTESNIQNPKSHLPPPRPMATFATWRFNPPPHPKSKIQYPKLPSPPIWRTRTPATTGVSASRGCRRWCWRPSTSGEESKLMQSPPPPHNRRPPALAAFFPGEPARNGCGS